MNSDSGVRDYVGIRKGIEGHSLGELEAQILDIVWELDPPITAAMVFKVMYPMRELSYSTIMLTMSKLAKKGFLAQERSGPRKTDAYHYAPTIARQELGRKLLEEIARRIFHKSLSEAVLEITENPFL
jgi:predicted transcriptional regulator